MTPAEVALLASARRVLDAVKENERLMRLAAPFDDRGSDLLAKDAARYAAEAFADVVSASFAVAAELAEVCPTGPDASRILRLRAAALDEQLRRSHETTVVNVRQWDREDVRAGRLEALGVVYVGRAVPSWGLGESRFGNPIRLDASATEAQRLEAVEGYREYLRKRWDLCELARRTLRGRRLACWCAPLPCHADVLADVAERGAP